jgi:hypothetical protein
MAGSGVRDRPLVPEGVRWNMPQVPQAGSFKSTSARPAGCWAAGWCWLLGLQQPHVGGLGALRPLLDVELDGLPLIK